LGTVRGGGERSTALKTACFFRCIFNLKTNNKCRVVNIL
jgi:hypothetical protein